MPGSGTDSLSGISGFSHVGIGVVCAVLLRGLGAIAIVKIRDVSNPAQIADGNPIRVKLELIMRATLRLLKSVFLTNAFSLEAGTIQGAGMAVSAMPTADENFSPLTAWACRKCDAAVTVRQLPANMVRRDAQDFFREVEPCLKIDRAHLVFDLSEVTCIDSTGVDGLLRCVQAASKRGGDLKLAGVSTELAVILEWTKAGRLFEIFESASDAVHSFHQQQFKREA